MESFWDGFFKKAESVIEDWKAESVEAAKPKKKKRFSIGVSSDNPATSALSYTPDVYWRSWP